jgi:hypothetical protein
MRTGPSQAVGFLVLVHFKNHHALAAALPAGSSAILSTGAAAFTGLANNRFRTNSVTAEPFGL